MKKLLIVKTGNTFDSIVRLHGDFDDFVIKQAGLSKSDVSVVSVHQGEALPSAQNITGVVITGSHSMVTDKAEWSERTAAWLRSLAGRSIPVLGICYGHQLIGHAFGGVVDYHPKGPELATVNIKLTAAGQADPLLGCLDEIFPGHVVHSQTVLRLPPQATLLAGNDFEPHHAFVIHDCIWGVQFHPEFNADIALMCLDELQAELIGQGYDPCSLRESVKEHPCGNILFKRFLSLL